MLMKLTTSDQAISRLKEGNGRFTAGIRSMDTIMSPLKLPSLAEKGQRPFAMVLTCSDSRVPVEMVFDQGVGDLFVVRVAGNVVSSTQLASLELAATQFSCSLLLVLGHTQCGAVRACLDHHISATANLSPALKDLYSLLSDPIRNVLPENFQSGIDNQNHLNQIWDLAVLENIQHAMNKIRSLSTTLHQLEAVKKMAIVGAVFNLNNGEVSFN